jgi:hypothetical protein
MTIEKICGSVEGVSLIDRWKATLKEQSAKNVVDGAKDVLCFTILLIGVGARHAEDYTMGEEERAGRGVIELTAIVALNNLDRRTKMCVHTSKKAR